jgi:hypothetical protein
MDAASVELNTPSLMLEFGQVRVSTHLYVAMAFSSLGSTRSTLI